MDTMINWLHVRGLGALATIGIFLVYAALAGWWQGRNAHERVKRAVEQEQPSPLDRSLPADLEGRAA
jgi:hypothetical protein